MEFTEIAFYDYKIRMTTIDGTKMFLVSDLLRQYNEKHNTNKQFKHYLENKQTQEVVEELAKGVGLDLSLRSEGGQNGQSTVGPNSGLPSNGSQDGQNTVGRNSDLPSNNDQNSSLTFLV